MYSRLTIKKIGSFSNDDRNGAIFASLARAHEHVRIQNVRDFAQTKPDSEINAPFLSNEHGDPLFF